MVYVTSDDALRRRRMSTVLPTNTRKQAQQLHVSPPSKPTLKQRATYAAQSVLHGASFDRRFVNHMIRITKRISPHTAVRLRPD
jgi:hypothetical protein